MPRRGKKIIQKKKKESHKHKSRATKLIGIRT